MISTEVRLQGAALTGLANGMVAADLAGATYELASYTKYEVLAQLDRVLQHPTGYYESQIQISRQDLGTYTVTDGNVIYGPWLEGVSSRNATTRFKGYHTFRIVKNRVAQKSRDITDAWIRRRLGRL